MRVMDIAEMESGSCPDCKGKDLMASAQCHRLHNGVEMPILGLGTWRLVGERAFRGINSALKAGYGLIDSAAAYANEQEIGDLLRRAGSPRVFLTTKLDPEEAAKGADAVLKAFETSRQKLGVDQIDLYLIHWPATGKMFTINPDSRERRLESWRALEQLYEQQKVRAIGVCNYMVKHLEELLALCRVKPMVNQIEWHPLCWDPDLLEYAKKHDIVLQAYASLGAGEQHLTDHPVIKEIAEEIKQPPAVVLLRWSIQQGVLVIPASASYEHIMENAAALKVELTEDQMNRLCRIKDEEQRRFYWDPNLIP